MKVALIFLICLVAIWYFLDTEPEPDQDSAGYVQQQSAESQFSERVGASANHAGDRPPKASANQTGDRLPKASTNDTEDRLAKQTFLNLPSRPELSAPIAEQADYVLESCAYWCGQLAQALKSDSATRLRALTEDLPIYLSAHRSTLDLCYAKITASEATIAERSNDSTEVQRKRLAVIDALKRELEAVETYLAKCDILWDDVATFSSGLQSSTTSKQTRDWVSQLHNLMEAAAIMLQ